MKNYFTKQGNMENKTTKANKEGSMLPARTMFGSLISALIVALILHVPASGFAQPKNGAPLPYLIENFDGYAFQSMPTGWTGNFQVWPFGGENSTYRLTRRIVDNSQVWSWETPLVAITADATFEFAYRVVEPSDYPANATPAENFQITLLIKEPTDIAFQELMVIDDANHIVSADYAANSINLDAWVGKEVVIRAEVLHLAGDFWADFDYVMVGAFYNANFTLVNTDNNPVENATVSVDGFGNQLTDLAGQASFELPAGDFIYNIAANNYLTYNDGSFTLADQDIVVATPDLIGNFAVTFITRDQATIALPGVSINWEGTAQSYDGPVEVTGTLVSGLTGVAVNHMPNGNYSFTARLPEYYDATGTFSQSNAVQQVDISLQVHPEVTFTVVEDDGNGGDLNAPIQGAAISIEGFADLITNIDGEATGRFPIGIYTYIASKIGFYENSSVFEITENNTSYNLTPIPLAVAPPTFAFSDYEIGQEVVIDRVPVGENSKPLEIEFINIGSGTVTVDPADIVLSGAGSTYFSITKPAGIVNLATGETAIVTLVFEPENADIQSALLEINYTTAGKNKALATLLIIGEPFIPVATPFYEDFESGNFDNWFVANGTQVNQWHVGNAANDPENLSAMVSNNGGASNSYQTSGATSVTHFYTDIDIPDASEGDLKIQFNWKGLGESTRDFLRVHLVETSTIPQSGSPIVLANIASLGMQTNWQTFTYTIPTNEFNKKRRLIFTWRNDASGGVQPPLAVDNIYIGSFYSLAVAVANTGTGSATGNGSFGAGMPVPVEATPAAGYEFEQWTSTAGIFEDETAASTLFIMPAEAATVTAAFKPIAPVAQNLSIAYDGTEKSASATVTSGFNLIWYDAASGGNPTNAPTATQAGTYTAWAVAKDANNLESNRVEVTLTITQSPLIIAATNINKIVGDVYTFSGNEYITVPASLYALDEVAEVSLISAGALAEALVGNYTIFISDATGTGLENYNITYQNGTLTVIPETDPIELSITGVSIDNKIYDSTTDAVVSNWGTLNGIDSSYPDVTLDVTNAVATFETPNVGEDIVVTVTGLALTGADALYYSIAEPVTATADIQVRDLTVTADNLTKTYGDTDPVLTANYSGFAGNDDESVLTGTLLISREPGEDAGTYAIVASGVSSTNYTITFVPGELEITTRAVTIAADNQSKMYGENDPALTVSLAQGLLISGDAITGSPEREAGENVGVYEIMQGTVAISDNYTITFEAGEFEITVRPITLAANDMSKVYGEDDPTLTVSLAQGMLISGDAITGAPEREAGEAVGDYDILRGSVAISDNYTITFEPGVFTITTKELTIGGSFAVADKVFDGTTDATITTNNLTLVGVAGSDDVSLVNVVAEFANAGPGTNINVTLTAAALDGTTKDNYTLSLDGAPVTTASIGNVLYTLTLNVTPANSGNVTGAGDYAEASVVTLEATPANNYIFVRWQDSEGASLGTSATLAYTMPGADITLTAVFQSTINVDEIEAGTFEMFPNPASERVTIRSGAMIEQVYITDITGRLVYSSQVDQTEMTINTDSFNQGIYLVRIHTTEGVMVKKLQVK